MIPRQDNVLDPHLTQTFLAIRSGCHTLTDIAEVVGHSRTTVHRWVLRLRRMGLVAWEPSTSGTIHALYG